MKEKTLLAAGSAAVGVLAGSLASRQVLQKLHVYIRLDLPEKKIRSLKSEVSMLHFGRSKAELIRRDEKELLQDSKALQSQEDTRTQRQDLKQT